MTQSSQSAIQKIFAGFWLRFAAMLLDVIAFMVCVAVLQLGYVLLTMPATVTTHYMPTILRSENANIVAYLLFWVYFVVVQKRRGQTLGKMAVGIRIVQDNGLPVDYQALFMRYSPFIFFDTSLAVLRNAASPNPEWINSVAIVKVLFILIIAISIAANSQKRGFHDLLGRTMVVKLR